jgi:hypothetical protein
MAKIKLDIYNLTVVALIVYLKAIRDKITNNPVFASMASRVAAFAAAILALETAKGAADAADQTAKQRHTELDAARVVVEGLAREVANGAESITRDAAELEGAGFALQASRSPVGMMPQVMNVSATGGDLDGTVDNHWDPIKRGLITYIGERALSPEGPWTQFYIGKESKCTATGLVSGTEYWFRFCAVGTAGPGPWSDRASKRAT